MENAELRIELSLYTLVVFSLKARPCSELTSPAAALVMNITACICVIMHTSVVYRIVPTAQDGLI